MSAKDIIIQPISAQSARRVIAKHHYSGRSIQNSQLNFGVFLDDKLYGALQFGPPMDRRKLLPLVNGTGWHEMIELNRMAFGPELPRNSESRALSVCFSLIKKNYSHLKWVVSYADACQCGDGTIYRAAGFLLTGIKKNTTLLRMPDGSIVADKTLNHEKVKNAGWWKKNGAEAVTGFQLRYIFFLKPEYKNCLTVPVLPFSEIDRAGAAMYKGKAAPVKTRGKLCDDSDQLNSGGETPTTTLQTDV